MIAKQCRMWHFLKLVTSCKIQSITHVATRGVTVHVCVCVCVPRVCVRVCVCVLSVACVYVSFICIVQRLSMFNMEKL